MKNRVFVVCLLAATSAGAAFAQGATKVGTINIQAAIVSTREGRAAVKALEERAAPKKKELEQAQSEINGLRDKLNKMSSVGSEDEKRKLMSDIDARTKRFNREVEDASGDMDQEQNRLLNELGGRMIAVLDKYGKDNGYSIILDVSGQNSPVLFASNQVDITQDVIGLYDKNSTAPVSAAPPASFAPAPAKAAPASSPKPPPAKAPAGVK